jgi:formiminotetrahydrofolate cyclodeaminase
VGKVNRYLLSDLAVAIELAMATVRSAGYNVRVNLPELKDPAERARLLQEQQQAVERAVKLVQQAIPAIWKRVEGGA